jgi:putative ABC transport system permease protein
VLTAPWWRAPALLLGRPVVFCAITLATAVLAVAASAGTLFASTLGTAALAAQAAGECPERAMPTFSMIPDPRYLAEANASGVAAMRTAGISGSAYWVDLTATYVRGAQVTLYARAGALQHVRRLSPDRGLAGVWVPDDFAAKLGLRPGDTVRANGSAIRVAGIYRSLSPDPFHLAELPRYWCAWSGIIVQGVTGNGPGAPPLLIADVRTVAATAAARGTDLFNVVGSGINAVPTGLVLSSWYAPVPLRSTSLARVRELTHRLGAAKARTGPLAPDTPPDFDDTVRYGPGAQAPPIPLLDLDSRAQRIQNGLTGSVVPISLAGAAVAMLLVAGAGGSWASRRHREIRLLCSRGVSPWAIGVKALLEALLPAAAGLAGGYTLSYLLVRSTGPVAVFAPGAAGQALLAAGGAVLAGLVVIAVIGALAAREPRRGGPPPGYRSVLRNVPYELVLVAAAGWVWLRTRSGTGIAVDQAIVDIRPLLLVFPVLGLSGVLLFAGRLAALGMPHLGAAARRLARTGYLALRRIGRSRAFTVGLLLGTALPCTLLTYAATVSTGIEHEVVRKYQTNAGAPHVLSLIGVGERTPRLAGHGTAVVRYANGATLSDGSPVTVLGIDPATFADYAYVDRAQATQAQRLPSVVDAAVLVHAPAALAPGTVRIGTTRIPVHVIARDDVFPGLPGSTQPMLVLDRGSLAHIDPAVDRGNEVWTSAAQVDAVSRVIARDGYTVLTQFAAQVRVTNSGLLPVTWIFGYLRALAVLIGAVAIAGTVFALSARTRRRAVAYVMSRRMGLTKRAHLRSLLIELGLVVGLGWLLGTAAGLGGYLLLLGSLDVAPQLPPGALFDLPMATLLLTAAAVAALITIAAGGAHAGAERTPPAEILRLE